MAAAHTPSDLGSFIRSSPILYHCFLEEKRSILLSCASRQLGRAILEAAVVAQVEGQFFYGSEADERRADVVRAYGRQLAKPQPRPWGLDVATVVPVIRRARTTEFFVDLYESTRLRALRRMDPASAKPFSWQERGRISLAFTRLQILMRLFHRGNLREAPDEEEELKVDSFLALFRPWEMEQISEAHALVYNACVALTVCEGDDRWEHILYDISYKPQARTFMTFYWDLKAFRRGILERGEEFLELMSSWMAEDGHWDMEGTFCARLDNSHQSRVHSDTNIPTREELCGPRPPVGTEPSADAVADAPYGWRDALEGRDWPVWGQDLLQDPRPLADWISYDNERGISKLSQWRWMGFVFWDRERVEAVKRMADFSGYQTGWLVKLRASGD